MFNNREIQSLKQTNISVDAEKVKVRVAAAWKAAAKEKQEEILALAGIRRSSVQRAYRTGNASAKLIVSMAQALNIDPFYLLGRSDEHAACTTEALVALLESHQYTKLVAQHAKDEKKQRRVAEKTVAAPVEKEAPESSVQEDTPVCSVQEDALPDTITEDEMVLLLKALLLKARHSGKHAKLADRIKELLLF